MKPIYKFSEAVTGPPPTIKIVRPSVPTFKPDYDRGFFIPGKSQHSLYESEYLIEVLQHS